MLNFNIIGLNPVTQRLSTIVDNTKLENALDKGADLVDRDAKHLVRVDTGRLRASINIIKVPLKRYIGSGVIYAPAQEFGRQDIPAYGYTPYLRPALRKNKQEIARLIKGAFENR